MNGTTGAAAGGGGAAGTAAGGGAGVEPTNTLYEAGTPTNAPSTDNAPMTMPMTPSAVTNPGRRGPRGAGRVAE